MKKDVCEAISVEAQDATMADVGERVRPPGEPPDVPASWVKKVTGSGVGGLPVPENLMNDEFVSARLQLDFPNGDDGEPVITIGAEMLDVMNGRWKQCMVVKVLGRNISIAAMSRKLREMWQPKGAMYVMDLPRQFFMIRFEREEEYMAALTGGPWRAFGSYLTAQAWSPEFDPMKDDIVTTPVWVRLSNIPVNFYHRSILMGIARGLGKPVKVDLTTLNFERARFARVCVEVNLMKPLKGSVMINGERYYVAYEGLTNICSSCGIYGHMVHSCPRVCVEKVTEEMASTEIVESRVPKQGSDGFTVVRRSGRRASPPENRIAFNAGGSKQDMGRNLRDISGKKNIEITNRFGSLGNISSPSEIREVAISGEENKENESQTNQGNKGKGVSQVMEGAAVGVLKKGIEGEREGFKNYRAGPKSGSGSGPKPKIIKQNRLTRGLVFGPTREETELAKSGKRLRVEKGGTWRMGGVFAGGGEEGRLEVNLVKESSLIMVTPQSEVGGETSGREIVMRSDLPDGGGKSTVA